MAITTTPTPEGAHVEPTREEARQGQNIKGMLTVLLVSLFLVIAAYGAMLALFGGSDKADDAQRAAAAGTAATSQPADGAPQKLQH